MGGLGRRVGCGAAAAVVAATGCVAAAGGVAAATSVATCGSVVVSATDRQGATGHGFVAVVFTNRGSVSCTLTGYPAVAAVGGSDQVLAQAQRSLEGFAGGASAVSTVTVSPGGTASATVEWLNFNPVTTGDCTFSAAIKVTPPGVGGSTRLPVSVSVCQLQVHPIVAGSSGQAAPSVPTGSGGLAATSDNYDQGRLAVAGVGAALVLTGAAGLLRRRRHTLGRQ